jgi:hypothetical protein
MKRPILILLALFALFSATAQRHYYVGIPFHQNYLKDSTKTTDPTAANDCLGGRPTLL